MRILKAVIISIAVFILVAPVIVLAAIATPTTQTVNTFNAYRSVINENDQLYIVAFSLDYGSNPTDSAYKNFLFRLKNNGVEIAAVAPVSSALNDNGYDDGIVSFYFPETSAILPTWGTANLSVEFVGNPSLDWGGDPPSVTIPAVDNWYAASQLPISLRLLANALETKWAEDLIELVNSTYVFTADGESYFVASIPNLALMSPSLFLNVTVQPEYVERTYSETYATTAEDRLVGTNLDTTNAANELNIGRVWLNSIIWVAASFGIMISIIVFLGKVRPATFIFGVCLVIGSFAGFMTFLGAVFVGVAGGLSIAWSFFYRGAP